MSDADINRYLVMVTTRIRPAVIAFKAILEFISKIEGCFYCVMGLPLNTVREILMDLENHSK